MSKTGLALSVIVAETVTVIQHGAYLMSIVNTNDQEIKIGLPTVKLSSYEIDTPQIRTSAQGTEEMQHRIHELRNMIQTDHLNGTHWRSFVKICEDYNDVFHLLGGTCRLTITTATEYAIPTLE